MPDVISSFRLGNAANSARGNGVRSRIAQMISKSFSALGRGFAGGKRLVENRDVDAIADLRPVRHPSARHSCSRREWHSATASWMVRSWRWTTGRKCAVGGTPSLRATPARASANRKRTPKHVRESAAPAMTGMDCSGSQVDCDEAAWRARPGPGHAYNAVPADRGRMPSGRTGARNHGIRASARVRALGCPQRPKGMSEVMVAMTRPAVSSAATAASAALLALMDSFGLIY